MDDILRRTLEFLGYEVQHVMNITDVGHLTGDDDYGDDKLEKGAIKQHKTVWQIAELYTEKFFVTMDALGVLRPKQILKATEHVPEMIDLIVRLKEKGHTYETEQAIYFDVSTFPLYGRLSGQVLEEKKQAVREEVVIDADKKHPADFALWFKRVGRFADHTMHWASPWGEGFPGWHIECSAMSMAALGETIDIHSGGIDHIPVHHENEIAQSEAATGKQFVKWWVHHAFLKVAGEKMSKSKGNFYTLKDIQERNINPMALRYLFLQTHYRKELNFTWEALESAHEAYKKLKMRYAALLEYHEGNINIDENSRIRNTYIRSFRDSLEDDLNLPQALSTIWDSLRPPVPSQHQLSLLHVFNHVLGLGLSNLHEVPIPPEISEMARQIDAARKNRDYVESDNLRKKVESRGYIVQNSAAGTLVKKSE